MQVWAEWFTTAATREFSCIRTLAPTGADVECVAHSHPLTDDNKRLVSVGQGHTEWRGCFCENVRLRSGHGHGEVVVGNGKTDSLINVNNEGVTREFDVPRLWTETHHTRRVKEEIALHRHDALLAPLKREPVDAG